MKNFALIGAAGYIAPRHMKAIKDTKNNLTVAYDISDSVGIIDNFFPKSLFYSNYNDFEEFININKSKLDFFSICSPNFLHYKHIELGLKMGCNVICEKPLVENVKELKKLKKLEEETGNKTYNILQLRHHSEIKKLKKEIDNSSKKIFDVELTYITSRGPWYLQSWKNDLAKGFGIIANIGIHFFDILYFLFGKNLGSSVHSHDQYSASGFLKFEKAKVKWFLSIKEDDLPINITDGNKTYRNIKILEKPINFSKGFTELHSESYDNILKGNGFGLDQALPSIEIVEKIKNQKILIDDFDEVHPLLKNKLT